MVFTVGAALREGEVEVALCRGTSLQELEQAINAAIRDLTTRSRDPQLLDIKYPPPVPAVNSEWDMEYTAMVIWQH